MKFLTIGLAERGIGDDRASMAGLSLAIRLALAALVALVVACGASTPTAAPSLINHDLHAYPELEAQLPDRISGRALTKVSLAVHPERQDRKTLAVLTQLGRSVGDLQVANGELEGTDLLVGAMRVVGSEGGRIIDAFAEVDARDPNNVASYTDVELGGKSVTARTVDGTSSYLYGAGDVMFIVSGGRPLVEAALELLP